MLRTIKYLCTIFIVSSSSLFAQQDFAPQDFASQENTSAQDSPYMVSKDLMPFPDGASFTRMWITIAAALVLLFVTLWLLRRFKTGHFKGFNGCSSTLNIIERRTLSPKTMLYIIEINNRRILISESQVEVRTLSQNVTCDPEKN
jgi:flagellar biogenesis protein FliO